MRNIASTRTPWLLAGTALLTPLLAGCRSAERTIDLEVTQVYAAEPALAERTAMYFTVTNGGSSDDELLAVSTPIAGITEMHRTFQDGELMKMVRAEQLSVPADGRLQLLPGKVHIMLLELRRSLEPGDRFDATLHFRGAGDVTVRGLVLPYAELEERLTAARRED